MSPALLLRLLDWLCLLLLLLPPLLRPLHPLLLLRPVFARPTRRSRLVVATLLPVALGQVLLVAVPALIALALPRRRASARRGSHPWQLWTTHSLLPLRAADVCPPQINLLPPSRLAV